MDKPFVHLDIPYSVKPTWRNAVENFNVKQAIHIKPEDAYEDVTLQFFDDHGLYIPAKGLCALYSWPPQPRTMEWHTDQSEHFTGTVVLNYLLAGDPGKTEWCNLENVFRIPKSFDEQLKTPDIRYVGACPARYSESIIQGYAMMMRSDVPHRVVRENQQTVRWTLRVFPKLKDGDRFPSWEEAVAILGRYELKV